MPLISLVYRTAGVWGAGKGSNLTAAEVDENFYDIAAAIDALTSNPPEANNIDSITQSTDKTQITIHMDDGTTQGPFTLPVASFKNRGPWAPSTAYKANDFFSATDPATSDGFLYFVNRDFTSGTTFIPSAGAGVGGADPYATPLVPMPSKVRAAFFFPGKPGVGLPDLASDETFAVLFSYLTVDAWYVKTTDTGSVARLRKASEFDMSFTIYKNESPIGGVAFTAGNPVGVVAIDFDTDFAPADLLQISGPNGGIDSLAHALSITIVGTLGEIGSSS